MKKPSVVSSGARQGRMLFGRTYEDQSTRKPPCHLLLLATTVSSASYGHRLVNAVADSTNPRSKPGDVPKVEAYRGVNPWFHLCGSPSASIAAIPYASSIVDLAGGCDPTRQALGGWIADTKQQLARLQNGSRVCGERVGVGGAEKARPRYLVHAAVQTSSTVSVGG